MQSRGTKAIALFSFDEEDKRIIDRHRRTGRVSHTSPGFFKQALRTDRAPQAERPWQPSAFSWIYLILQHSEVMKARQTLGKEYTTTLFRAICLHLKKKREKNPPSTGRSVNKSNHDRTSFMPDAHVRFVIPCSHLIKQKASPQPLSVAISMETACTAAIRFFWTQPGFQRGSRWSAAEEDARVRGNTK